MSPGYLTDADFRFLGQPMRSGQGVNPVLAEVLTAVEADLTGTDNSLTESIIGWRSRDGFHASGSAVDLT